MGAGAWDPASNKNPDFLKLPFGNLKLQNGKKPDKKVSLLWRKKEKRKDRKGCLLAIWLISNDYFMHIFALF